MFSPFETAPIPHSEELMGPYPGINLFTAKMELDWPYIVVDGLDVLNLQYSDRPNHLDGDWERNEPAVVAMFDVIAARIDWALRMSHDEFLRLGGTYEDMGHGVRLLTAVLALKHCVTANEAAAEFWS